MLMIKLKFFPTKRFNMSSKLKKGNSKILICTGKDKFLKPNKTLKTQ